MSILVGAGITMLIQIGTSVINMKYSQETTAKIKDLQQKFKRESQDYTLEREHERFLRSCALQLEIEEKNHVENLKDIEQDFINSIKKWAHSKAIDPSFHYPLRISPYIIGKSVLPIYGSPTNNSRKELFCILTGSNDTLFNKIALPILDNILCEKISEFWNLNSMHTVCYYPDIWNKEKICCDEDIENLKTIIKTPTITITPFIENCDELRKLSIKIHLWGTGNTNSISSQIIESGIVLEKHLLQYKTEELESIIVNLFSHVICVMGEIVDTYYWGNNYQAPILPSILSKGLISHNQEVLNSITLIYVDLFKKLALGLCKEEDNIIPLDEVKLLQDVAEINQYNFPQRSMSFLYSMTEMLKNIPDTSVELIKKTLFSLYKARTGESIQSLSEIDVKLLMREDFDIISEMINMTKCCNNDQFLQELIDVIRRKISV